MKTSRTKTSRWPSRNDTWTEVYAGNVHSTFMHARTLFRATYTERKGVGSLSHLSSTGRRADNSRCGANATAAIDDVLLRFLELTHTLLCPFYLPSPFDYHFVYSAPFLSPRLFFLSIHFACAPFSSRFPWIPFHIDVIILSLFCRRVSSTKFDLQCPSVCILLCVSFVKFFGFVVVKIKLLHHVSVTLKFNLLFL